MKKAAIVRNLNEFSSLEEAMDKVILTDNQVLYVPSGTYHFTEPIIINPYLVRIKKLKRRRFKLK